MSAPLHPPRPDWLADLHPAWEITRTGKMIRADHLYWPTQFCGSESLLNVILAGFDAYDLHQLQELLRINCDP